MILTCPECTTSYEADDALLGPTGRKVKCHNCSNIWMVTRDVPVEDMADEIEFVPNPEIEHDPEIDVASAEMDPDPNSGFETDPVPNFSSDPDDFGEAVEVPDAEISTETETEETIETPDRDAGADEIAAATVDIEKLASRERARSRISGAALALQVSKIQKFAAIAAAILLVVSGLVMFQDPMVRLAPGMARLYALVGIEVNLRGLEFRDIAYARAYEDGLTVLTVRGEIVNITDAPVELPMIRFSLRNGHEQEIYHWSGSAGRDLLLPSGAVPFETRLASPPAAQEILVRFAR